MSRAVDFDVQLLSDNEQLAEPLDAVAGSRAAAIVITIVSDDESTRVAIRTTAEAPSELTDALDIVSNYIKAYGNTGGSTS